MTQTLASNRQHTKDPTQMVAFVGDGGWQINDHEEGDECEGCCGNDDVDNFGETA